jgi:O-antigen/teichoic acid export membrane protein
VKLPAISQHTLLLLLAMATRILASAMYVLTVFLVNRNASSNDAAAFVYVIAICFVSSALGRIGSDQQISANADLLRRKHLVKAASLFYVCLLTGLVLVPAVAVLVHVGIIWISPASAPQVGIFTIAVTAMVFAAGQSIATMLQAKGMTVTPILIFPLLPHVVLGVTAVVAPTQTLAALPAAFAVPMALGLLLALRVLPFVPRLFSLRWMKDSWHYYILDINHFVGAWAPFTYLHLLLSAGDIVLLNLATRISALQSMPSNAVAAYLMPQFAINYKDGNRKATEAVMAKVILVTLAFQFFYLVALALLYVFNPSIGGVKIDTMIIILIVLSIGQFVNGLTGPVGPALLMSGNRSFMAKTSWVIFVASIILGIILAKLGGVLAFSFGVAFAVIAQNLIYSYVLYRRTGISLAGMAKVLLRR